MYRREKPPSISTNSLCIVIVVDLRKSPRLHRHLNLRHLGVQLRDARLSLSVLQLPPWPYTVHLYSVLTDASVLTAQVSTREGRGHTHAPETLCGPQQQQGSPHPHMLASSARCESITRDERDKKKKEKRKTHERHSTRECRGEGRGPGPPAHVKRADLPHSPNPYKLACTVRVHPTGNHQSPGASRGRGPKGTHGRSRSEISF